MRRTRYVVLPVRSWYYVGLMVVSLACLTLGLVSRDREGKSGSLTSPELKHTAPHEVDACPNESPYGPRPMIKNDLAPYRIDAGKRVLERRTRDSNAVRTPIENRRLSRMQRSRSIERDNIKTRIDERRAMSLERRLPDISRLDERRSRQARENRISSEINGRLIKLQQRLTLNTHRERIVREDIARFHDRRLAASERRERVGTEHRERNLLNLRRVNIRTDGRSRSLERQMSRVRVNDSRRENRQTNERALIARREIRTVDPSAIRVERSRINEDESTRRVIRMNSVGDLARRQLSRERRNSVTHGQEHRVEERVGKQRYNNRHTDNYLTTGTGASILKLTSGNGNYELLRQTFILVLCSVYTMSFFKRKSGFMRNILPGINRLRVL